MGDVQAQAYEENHMLSQYKDLDVRTLLPRQALAETQYLGMMEVEQGQSGAWRAEKLILALMVHNVIDHRAVRWIKRDQLTQVTGVDPSRRLRFVGRELVANP